MLRNRIYTLLLFLFGIALGVFINTSFHKNSETQNQIKISINDGKRHEPPLEESFALMLNILIKKNYREAYSDSFLSSVIKGFEKANNIKNIFFVLRVDSNRFEILISPKHNFRNGKSYFLLTEKNIYLLDNKELIFIDSKTKREYGLPPKY